MIVQKRAGFSSNCCSETCLLLAPLFLSLTMKQDKHFMHVRCALVIYWCTIQLLPKLSSPSLCGKFEVHNPKFSSCEGISDTCQTLLAGICSRHGASVMLEGSPAPAVGSSEGLISVQFYKSFPTTEKHDHDPPRYIFLSLSLSSFLFFFG